MLHMEVTHNCKCITRSSFSWLWRWFAKTHQTCKQQFDLCETEHVRHWVQIHGRCNLWWVCRWVCPVEYTPLQQDDGEEVGHPGNGWVRVCVDHLVMLPDQHIVLLVVVACMASYFCQSIWLHAGNGIGIEVPPSCIHQPVLLAYSTCLQRLCYSHQAPGSWLALTYSGVRFVLLNFWLLPWIFYDHRLLLVYQASVLLQLKRLLSAFLVCTKLLLCENFKWTLNFLQTALAKHRRTGFWGSTPAWGIFSRTAKVEIRFLIVEGNSQMCGF
jgi:hypothetical protein